jgi:hypothetical protein
MEVVSVEKGEGVPKLLSGGVGAGRHAIYRVYPFRFERRDYCEMIRYIGADPNEKQG